MKKKATKPHNEEEAGDITAIFRQRYTDFIERVMSDASPATDPSGRRKKTAAKKNKR